MKKKVNKTDFSEILRTYENMWVALSKEKVEVIAAEKTLEKLFEKLSGKDYREFEFMKVPKFGMGYAPLFL